MSNDRAQPLPVDPGEDVVEALTGAFHEMNSTALPCQHPPMDIAECADDADRLLKLLPRLRLAALPDPGLREAVVEYLAADDDLPDVKPEDEPTEEWDRRSAIWKARRNRLDDVLSGTASVDRVGGEGLDVAWKAVEAALPRNPNTTIGVSIRVGEDGYYAWADDYGAPGSRGQVMEEAIGPTPAAALRALASRLTPQEPESRSALEAERDWQENGPFAPEM